MKLTHEDVDILEDRLRYAEQNLEKAARRVCSAEGENAIQMYNMICALIAEVQNLIHVAYRLRPEDGDGEEKN